jgi:YVTN family beta-propeller protein
VAADGVPGFRSPAAAVLGSNAASLATPAELVEIANTSDADYREPAETVIATIPVGGAAGDIAAGPDSDRVYVATGNAVTVIDSRNEIAGTVPIPGHPKRVVANAEGTRVGITTYDGPVLVLNTAGNLNTDHNVARVLPGPASTADAVSPDGACIYTVCNATAGSGDYAWISVVDIEQLTVRSAPVGNHVTGLAVSPDGRWLYAAAPDRGSYYQYAPGWLLVIDTAPLTLVDAITVGSSPDTVTVSPDGAHVYLTHCDTDSISAVDLATHHVVTVAVHDCPLGVSVSPDSTHIYASNRDSLAVIDAATACAESIPIGSLPRRLQYSPDGKRAYVTNFGDQCVSVLDTITNSITTTVKVGGHPEAVAVSPNGERVYVTDYWAGTVTVISIPSVRN